jgi:hypothetical protein
MSARLKSEFWVAALLRRCSVNGVFGAVLHKGAEEAGAVYVVIARDGRTCDFLGPAPGDAYDENGDRRFSRVYSGPRPWTEVSSRIAALRKIDPDIWVVEVETREGDVGLKVETE